MHLRKSLVLLCATAAIFSGCAAVEHKSKPAVPAIVVRPKTDSVEHISPPPLNDALKAENELTLPGKPGTPLNLPLETAIVLAIQNNRDLDVAEINPALQQTLVSEQRAVFDPLLSATYTITEDSFTRDLLILSPFVIPSLTGQTAATLNLWQPVNTEVKSRTKDYGVGISETLPTGTTISISTGKTKVKTRNSSTNPNLVYGTDTDTETSDFNVTVTQALLRGAGLGVNLASLRQAKLDTLASDYELRGVAEDLVAQVEQTYWDCVLAERQIKIFEEALNVAQTQALEVDVKIAVGDLAEIERAAADAEVALRRSSLIDAKANYDTLRFTLMRLINPAQDSLRPFDIVLASEPGIPEMDLNGDEPSILLAQRMRPDVNQAKLQIKRNDLEIVKTRNGLLPQLDVFIGISTALTRTNYTEAYLTSTQDKRDDRYTTQVGAEFSYPIGNRAARSRNTRAIMGKDQSELALKNLMQLVELDIRTAYVEVRRSHEQIDATAATRKLQEQTLAAEQEKYRLGRSNILLVSQAQRDLLSAQLDEVGAWAAHLKAIVNLYRLEGSLLERRGIDAPGREPVESEDALDLYKTRGQTAAGEVDSPDEGESTS
ncbi:MAG: hypothetical protein AMXMBFR84_32460 [Candidatus Hydrogenedentota bacterium]